MWLHDFGFNFDVSGKSLLRQESEGYIIITIHVPLETELEDTHFLRNMENIEKWKERLYCMKGQHES